MGVKFTFFVIALFLALLVCTVYLLRNEKITYRMAVCFIVSEILTLVLILFWWYLPDIQIAAHLSGKKLFLLIILLLFCGIVIFLLYAFTHITSQERQIKTLRQEIIRLCQAVNDNRAAFVSVQLCQADEHESEVVSATPPKSKKRIITEILALGWAFGCLLLYYYRNSFPDVVKAFLTANYLE